MIGSDNTTFGAFMRQAREDAGLSQTDAAAFTGVKREYISSVELGRITLVYPAQLNRLKGAYGVPGWQALEAMGYETDCHQGEGVIPALIHWARTLPVAQQRVLADMAKTLSAGGRGA